MAEGIDFAWARPGGATIKAAGKKFVVRYLFPGGGKGATRAELNDYISHGLLLAFIYEEDGLELVAGFNGGVRVAKLAEIQRKALGLPDNTPIYFAVDFDATGEKLNLCVSAIVGAVSVLGYDRVGGYGGVNFIDAIAGRCKYGWQTYGWSRGRVSANANLYQYLNGQKINGGSVDFCRNLKADFGAINGSTLVPTSSGSGGNMIGVNASGQTNASVQLALNRFGYKLVVDNIIGPLTSAAIIAFQKSAGITIDGIVGPKTWAALNIPAVVVPPIVVPPVVDPPVVVPPVVDPPVVVPPVVDPPVVVPPVVVPPVVVPPVVDPPVIVPPVIIPPIKEPILTDPIPYDIPLGNIITNPVARKVIYSVYAIAALAVGGIIAYFFSIGVQLPVEIVGAQAVIAYLAIPVGALALANTPPKSS